MMMRRPSPGSPKGAFVNRKMAAVATRLGACQPRKEKGGNSTLPLGPRGGYPSCIPYSREVARRVAPRGRCGSQSASGNRSLRGVSSEKETPPKSSAAAGYFRSWLTHPPQVKIKQHHQTQLETGVHRRGGSIFGSLQFDTPP